jgi:hypothetical protein
MSVGVSAFESTATYPCNHNSGPEYLFSISDNSETITSMETASPNMVLACVHFTSVTSPQNLLPISAEPSLNALKTVLLITPPVKKLLPPDF